MTGKLLLVGGFAAGYVLGSRAGRARYDQISATVRKVADDPAVANALEIVQTQAERLYANGRAAVGEKLHAVRAERLAAEDRAAEFVVVPM
jgi:hypothetical protein